VIVLWAALVIALTAATHSITWDLYSTDDDELVAMATPLLAEDNPPPQPTAAVRRGVKALDNKAAGTLTNDQKEALERPQEKH
jgi:hypothetical protein